jgi:glycosyltransferase involved in cell wall biosynthesis
VLVRNGDVRGLAAAIVALIEDEAERRRLGAAATQKARTYGMDVVGARWDALVAELTGVPSSSAPPPLPSVPAA